MSKRWLSLIPLLCALPSVAVAQTAGVMFQRSVLTLEEARINIEDLVDDETEGAPVRLSWSVTGLPPGAWDYELTYGAITETATAPQRLRVIETDGFAEAQGNQPFNGQLQVEVRLRDIIAAAEDLPVALGGTGRNDYDEAICVNIYPDGNPDFNQTASDCWTFEVDTLAPTAPTITELAPGEGRVQVTWDLLNDNDIEFYEVVYCTNVDPDLDAFDELPCPSSEWRQSGTISETQSRTSITRGINVGERVAVAMRSIDDFDNVGDPGAGQAVTSVVVDDFYELYAGDEEGGFCFIATAAHGSYAHPTVRVLRLFRDWVLLKSPLGTAFVAAYYRYSPPIAARVAADPVLAGWVRWALIPVALLSIVIMLGPLVFAAGLLGLIGRRWTSWKSAVAAMVIGISGLVPATAFAERPKSELRTIGLGFEFKGGPYSGAIQEDPGFADVFAAQSRPLFGLGIDLQVFRGFGTVIVGGTFGFLQYTGKGRFGKGAPTPGEVSTDTNVFNLVPLTAQLGYRFDWLADRTWIPLVPYVKGGLAYYIWWATDGVGNLQRRTVDEDRQTARGGTFGVTGTLGMAFMLNKIDSRVAQTLFSGTGIRGTYVFVEMTGAQVDDFGGSSFDLSDFNWSVGLYMEL